MTSNQADRKKREREGRNLPLYTKVNGQITDKGLFGDDKDDDTWHRKMDELGVAPKVGKATKKETAVWLDESAEMPDAWLEFVSKLKANDEEE